MSLMKTFDVRSEQHANPLKHMPAIASRNEGMTLPVIRIRTLKDMNNFRRHGINRNGTRGCPCNGLAKVTGFTLNTFSK